jgi:WD40 repeat protein
MLKRISGAGYGIGSSGDSRDSDIFISYQHTNGDLARHLAEALEGPNRRVWFDRKLGADSQWAADIERKLQRARCVVAIWSRKAATSGWVNYEAYRAHQEKKLIVVTFENIDQSTLPSWLSDFQINNLKGWRRRADDNRHENWLKVKALVAAKCSRLPEYLFKGWLGGGPTHEKVTSLVFHPTEEVRLISTGSEGSAAAWHVSEARLNARGTFTEDGELQRVDPSLHGQSQRVILPAIEGAHQRSSIWRAQYSTDGKSVALACRSGSALIFDLSLRQQLHQLDHNAACGAPSNGFLRGLGGQHKEGVLDVCFLPDGGIVTAGGAAIVAWNPDGTRRHAKPIVIDNARARIVRVQYSVAADALIVGDLLGKVRTVDPRVQNGVGSVIADRADVKVDFALGSDSGVPHRLLAVVSESPADPNIHFHDSNANWRTDLSPQRPAYSDPRPHSFFDEAPPIHSIALHPRAPVIAIGSNAVRPRLVDHATGDALVLPKEGWHDRPITAVAFSAQGKYLAVGSEDGRISIWEDHSNAL